MNPSLNPLDAEWLKTEPEIRARMDTVLQHRQFIMGPEVIEFEHRIAVIAGSEYAVSCGSGTDAMLLSLMAFGIGAGDAVFLSAFSFIAAAEAVQLLGATPVFVDIDPETFNIDPTALQESVETIRQDTNLTPRGVIPVDLFGLPADYRAIRRIAQNFELFVLTDAAHSLGAMFEDKRLGEYSDVAALSFFPTKPLGGMGDGGAVITNSGAIAEHVRELRTHGRLKKGLPHRRIGLNSRLDTIQAAVLLAKLTYFNESIASRRKVATVYTRALSSLVRGQSEPDGRRSSWAYYSVLSDFRDPLFESLQSKKIPVSLYYPRILPAEPVFASLGYQVGDFPVAEETSRRILHVPIHGYMNNELVEHVSDTIIHAIHEHTSIQAID